MATVHENINELLAADLHGELSDSEREELHSHLMECAQCRLHYKEERLTHKVLQSTLERWKPSLGFEQRMLSSFRNRVPDRRSYFSGFFVNALRWRTIQVGALAALFVGLVQTGRVLTGDTNLNLAQTPLAFFARPARAPGAEAIAARLAETGPMDVPAESQNDSGGEGWSGAKPDVGRSTDVAQPLAAATGSAVSENGKKPLDAYRAEDKPHPQEKDNVVATGSNIPTAEEVGSSPSTTPAPIGSNRKLIRNATVELEVGNFMDATQQIMGFANTDRGYVATSTSEKLENGKLRGEVTVKVLPENLDAFLGKLRGLGELKNQSIHSEEITKQYFDTDARLNNARLLETRLIELLKKKSDDVEDLLAVEKELGRIREQIEQLQGELKFMDIQVQFATVTISLAEKEMDIAAGFLLKQSVQLSLFAPDVEKAYAEIKAIASSGVEITRATLDRDASGRITAHVGLLIAAQTADSVIARVKSLGRVENYQLQSERVARGDERMSQNAKTERDKVQLNIAISQEDKEIARQQTSLSIRAPDVTAQSRLLRELAEKDGGGIRSSSFSRDPNGREYSNVAVRVPMKNYTAFMESLNGLGRLEDLRVHRDDRPDTQMADAPADISIQVYSQGNLVAEGSGLPATLRRTIEQGVSALMWSVRMIGVALAFLAPWMIALAAAIAIVRGIRRSRGHRGN